MPRAARTVVGVCAAFVCFLAGMWYGREWRSPASASSGRRVLYYVDPMHPAYKSGKPGVAPDCGMQLEPVYAGDGGQPRQPSVSAVEVSPERQQLIGVKVEEARRSSTSQTIRVSGRVALDETRVFRVTTAVDGWVRNAGPAVTGNLVQKDELLATFYNRDFLTAQQTYLYALNTMDRNKEAADNAEQLKLTQAQMRAAEENLEFLGMGESQIREISRTRQIARDIELRSPVAGLLMARNVFAGLRFDRGTQLFQVADISRVWVLANLQKDEARYVQPGQSAQVILPGPERPLAARFSAGLPQFDASSRVLKARLELDNPGNALRPDMFVDVEFPVTMPPALSVPMDAVVDSGRRKIVFVAKGDGQFEPRIVECGWRLGDRIEIVKGLDPGERIVVSGNFLLDSESRMKLAAAAPAASVKDPVCGMLLDPAKPGALRSDYKGTSYYFCMDDCKRKFDRNPEAYLKTPAR